MKTGSHCCGFQAKNSPTAFSTVLLLTVITAGCVQLTLSCSQMPNTDILNFVDASDVVFYGKVLRRLDNQAYRDRGMVRAYDVEMEVYCTFKGDRLPRLTNVSEAGYLLGRCQTYTMDPGNEYLVMSTEEYEDKLVLQKTLTSDDADAERVQKACNLNRQPPTGLAEVHENCPRAASENDCIAGPIEQHLNACKIGSDTHEHDETWLEHKPCVERCRCSYGKVVCNKICPPLGDLPTPSEHCPEPHFTPHQCCQRLSCYKDTNNNEEGTVDPETTETPPSPEITTQKPNVKVKNGGDTKKDGAENIHVVIKPPESSEARGDASTRKIMASQGAVAAILQMMVISFTVRPHLFLF